MEKIRHYFGDMVIANGYIWFPEENMNALFKANMKTLETEYVLSFPNKTNINNRLYCSITKCGDKLVCSPNRAREIAVYDIAVDSIEKIRVDFDKYSWRIAAMYGGSTIGKYVYLFRRGYSDLYILDTFSSALNMLDIVENKTGLEVGDYFWYWKIQQYKREEEIILYDKIHYILYQYNINTMKTEKLFCFGNNCELVDFVVDNQFIWALCSNGIIYKLDGSRIEDEYQCSTNAVDNLALYHCKNVVYVIDKDTGRVVFTLGNNDADYNDIVIPVNNTEVVSFYTVENKITIQWKDGFFYFYDGKDEVSGFLESDLKDIPAEAFYPKDIIYENKEYPLNKLLGVIGFQPAYSETDSVNESGEEIYYNTALTE